MPTATAPVVVTDQIAMVANAVAAEDAVAVGAVVAVEAKAAIARAHRRAEDPLALARRLPDQKTRLLRKPHPCHRVTVLITTKSLGIISLKSLVSGSRTIVRRHNRSSGQRNRTTRRRNPSTESRHNM